MGAKFAEIAIAALVVVGIYNVVSSGNSANIIDRSTGGAAQIIKALEGK